MARGWKKWLKIYLKKSTILNYIYISLMLYKEKVVSKDIM